MQVSMQRNRYHFDTNLNRERHSWLRGINSFLPASINVKWVRSVPSDFHARFSASREI